MLPSRLFFVMSKVSNGHAHMMFRRNRNLPQQLTLDHVSPATRLLEKRRHMFEVQEALDTQKDGK